MVVLPLVPLSSLTLLLGRPTAVRLLRRPLPLAERRDVSMSSTALSWLVLVFLVRFSSSLDLSCGLYRHSFSVGLFAYLGKNYVMIINLWADSSCAFAL